MQHLIKDLKHACDLARWQTDSLGDSDVWDVPQTVGQITGTSLTFSCSPHPTKSLPLAACPSSVLSEMKAKKKKKNYVQSTSRLYSGGMKAHVSEWMSSTSGTTGPCLPHHKLWSSFGEQNSRGIMLTHPTAVHCWVWTAGDCVLPQTRQEDKTAGGMVHPSICPPPKQSLYSPQNPIDMSDHNTAHTCMQGCFLLFFFKQSFIQSIYTGCKKMQFTKKDKFFTNSVF